METHWSSTAAGVTVICFLLTLTSALPTNPERDVAVRLRPTNNAAPDPNQVADSSEPSLPAAIQAPSDLHSDTEAQKIVPVSHSADRVVAPGADSSPTFANSVPSAVSNAFTNHFVLDTASLDLNGDGCIDGEPELDLFKYHVATALAGTPNNLLRAHSIVHRTDTNKDGRICWCDFISIYLHDKDEVNERHHSAPFVVILDKNNGMFSRLDDNRDGMLKGGELDSLTQQFAACIPEEQARLIVAAMTGLGKKDGAISSTEFARFLGMGSNKQTSPAQQAEGVKDQARGAAAVLPRQNQAAGIPGVVLTSTVLPKTSRAVDEQNLNMAATKNE
ncbi:hypothetical protein EGW08_015982 [Elysia chlorotica]|uniref:EF-hand domain-containing protein n=1 Tax=Elysia chlorotica TaxID=188477 RepID=A0A433T3X8_ELYCH|nr:hypothetical protein EGW08_015982 [Elysia chlorotica]